MRLEFCPERTSQVSHRCQHTSHHPFIYTLVHRHIYTSCSRATRSWGLVNWRELIDLLVIWDRKCLEIYSLWPKGDGDGVPLCVCVCVHIYRPWTESSKAEAIYVCVHVWILPFPLLLFCELQKHRSLCVCVPLVSALLITSTFANFRKFRCVQRYMKKPPTTSKPCQILLLPLNHIRCTQTSAFLVQNSSPKQVWSICQPIYTWNLQMKNAIW